MKDKIQRIIIIMLIVAAVQFITYYDSKDVENKQKAATSETNSEKANSTPSTIITDKHIDNDTSEAMVTQSTEESVQNSLDETNSLRGTHGTAKRLNGKTAIVSVFATDDKYKWDFDDEEDVYRYSECYEYLGIAVEWITDQAAEYGVECEFVWDWLEHSSLYYTYDFTGDMVKFYYEYDYKPYYDYISDFKMNEILQELDVESILFIFFYNTPETSPVGSYANAFIGSSANIDNNTIGYEYVCLFAGEYDQTTTPGTYAHEILHLFGAPDIYESNEEYNMSEAFTEEYHTTYPRDIMGGAPTDQYEYVQFTFSPLIAYYTGLSDYCDLVDKWGLRKSDYELYGY